MATESLVEEIPSDVIALKEYYEKQGLLKEYNKEFRVARNIVEQKISGLPSRFIPRWVKALDAAGVPGPDARRIVEADAASLGWKPRTILEHIPRAWKHAGYVASGVKGAEVTNAARGAARRGLAAASESVRRRVARKGGEARAEDVAGLAKAGRKGGRAVREQYGESYFSEIGSKAHEDEPELEQVLTGELEINPREWRKRIDAEMEKAEKEQRNVILVINENRLITLRLAGVSTSSSAPA